MANNLINITETRTMMQAINKMKPVGTFLRDNFFRRVETFTDSTIDVDIKKGKRKLAPFVAPRVGGIVMDRQGFETYTYKVPKIAPERITTADDIAKRGLGENVYGGKTPEERANELLGTDLADLDEMITRREEWQCREVLLNGKVTMKGVVDDKSENVVEQVVDFKFTNKETLEGTTLWNLSTADIHGDLKRWRLEILKKTGQAPNVVIMSSDVVDSFITNEKIQKIYDTMKFNMGTIEPRLIGDAVTRITFLPELNLEVWSYDEWFLDDDGVEQPMIPYGTVILARTNMGKRLYGAVSQVENKTWNTYEGTRIPKMWADEENDITKLRVSARPLPVPEDVDEWFVAIVQVEPAE